MKIVFIRPHSEAPSAPPPLGVLSLIAYLRSKTDHEYSVIDGRAKVLDTESIKPILENEKPDIVGITSFTMEHAEAHNIAKMSKSLFPDVPVLIGGPYTTSTYLHKSL